MKNITVSVDESLYHQARVAAAKAGKTVTALVREYLESLSDTESSHEKKVQHMFDVMDKVKGSYSASKRLAREDMYERR